MSSLCKLGMCHNLGSSTYQGYCNQDHQNRGPEKELLMKIVEKNPSVSTLKEARQFLREYIKKWKSKT